MTGSQLICLPALILSLLLTGPASGQTPSAQPDAAAQPPRRVVSMNLCTDQLAMLLAAPGQLYSVSALAADPRGSVMAEQAQTYRLNNGLAEDIWLMQPDLVIVGSFTATATVDMLRRLGVPVVVMDPAYGLANIPDRLRAMGRALGREAQAEAEVAAFETRLAQLQNDVSDRPRAALYYANSYTSGDRTLAGEILLTAGFANIASEVGLPFGGTLPLELLVLADPQTIISGRPYPGQSRSEDILRHPVLDTLRGQGPGAVLTDRDWACGTPFVLRAIEKLRDTRRKLERK